MEIVFFLKPDKKAIEAWDNYRRQMRQAHGDEALQFVERKPY